MWEKVGDFFLNGEKKFVTNKNHIITTEVM